MPLMAAMTGFQRSHDFGPRSSPGSSYMNELLVPNTVPSRTGIDWLRSMPTQNDRSPAPVTTPTLTELSLRMSRQTLRNSSCIAWLNAFRTSGRLRVTTRTAPCCSTVMVVYEDNVLLQGPG